MRKGFTLIEIVVVMGVLGFIMVSVTAILFNSFKAKNRIAIADVVDQNGTLTLSELKNNMVSAAGVGMSCDTVGGVGSTLSILSRADGQVTNLVCYENSKIASESANGRFDLTSSSVKVTGCNNFATCQLYPDTTDRVIRVLFSFGMFAGDASAGVDKFASRVFQSNVSIRN